mgnify:CR=1 FL=1
MLEFAQSNIIIFDNILIPKEGEKMVKVIELTKENEEQYLDQIVELEQITLETMKKEGREGQLFATGKEDISEYVHSDENSVIVAVNENGKVEATTYITQGQKPFTYNDITKYFKYGEQYRQYVKSQYKSEQAYKKDMLEMYNTKLQAFKYAKDRLLAENPEKVGVEKWLEAELKENDFHEKSELREKINQYMSQYIMKNYNSNIQKKYEQFYWTNAEEISKEFGKQISELNERTQEYESFMQAEYEEILKNSKLKIYEKPEFETEKYYLANTNNAVELDTYITLPRDRNSGLARIIVYEGIKKHIEKHFQNSENSEIFLCSTLHRDNLSSKYVSEFFGLKDSLYVNRRKGRDREVHIAKIPREQAMEYLVSMSDKLAVLYGYNPNNKHISNNTKKRVLEEQLKYEEDEHNRLKKAKTVLYCRNKTDHEKRNEIFLVQGVEDYYSGISLWKEQKKKDEEKRKLQVKVTTNSDYIMQAMLQKTNLCNISPNCLSHSEKSITHDTIQLENEEQAVQFVCLFRNDQKMEKTAKKFLTFIKKYMEE